MRGAREYVVFLLEGQYDRLYIETDSHARGYTLNIYVLPKDTVVTNINELRKIKYTESVVKVYGIVSGDYGWTESYGWLHKGPWEKSFYNLVENKKREIAEEKERKEREKRQKEYEEKQRQISTLTEYSKDW